MTYEAECVIDYDICCQFDEFPAAFPECVEFLPIDHNPQIPKEYVFGVGDALDVGIFGDDETYVEDATIAPDGNLYYLFLDAIPAAGYTVTQLSHAIAAQLNDFYVNPLVSIVPKTAINRTFSIIGRVNYPGVYPLLEPKKLRDAIADAGGPITTYYHDSLRSDIYELADLKNSFLVRDNKKMALDFQTLLHAADNSSNVPILPGDYIYIAAAEHQYVYVLGNVLTPQRVSYTEGLTAMGVLAIAGGWNSGTPYSADPSKLLVIRGSLKCPCVMQVDLDQVMAGFARDLFVQPGDIIYAQDKTVRFGRELVRLAISTFLQSFASSAGSYWSSIEWFN
jgi:polysaccharide export outer membrane protein